MIHPKPELVPITDKDVRQAMTAEHAQRRVWDEAAREIVAQYERAR